MAIRLQCECGRALRLKDHLAGKRVKCPDCDTTLSVPQPEAIDEAAFEVLADDSEVSPPKASSSYRSNYVAPPPMVPVVPLAPSPKKKRPRRRSSESRRGGGISISPGVIQGVGMMVGAVVWFILGLFAGWIFYYPPVLFIFGLIRFVMGLMGHEED